MASPRSRCASKRARVSETEFTRTATPSDALEDDAWTSDDAWTRDATASPGGRRGSTDGSRDGARVDRGGTTTDAREDGDGSGDEDGGGARAEARAWTEGGRARREDDARQHGSSTMLRLLGEVGELRLSEDAREREPGIVFVYSEEGVEQVVNSDARCGARKKGEGELVAGSPSEDGAGGSLRSETGSFFCRPSA